MLKTFSLAALLWTGSLFAAAEVKAPPAADPATAVSIEGGQAACAAPAGDLAVRAYLGVPYAAAPVGALRWKPPQPVVAWEGVRTCTAYGAVCPQVISEKNPCDEPMSEDCLFLNVWTSAPQAGGKQPVLVWIHGGGLARGSGSKPLYDGSKLARHGAVVVTLNYRLGPFGFFAHPLLSKESEHGVSGNYGFLDQVAALRWVKKNIAAFGGDPERVTIFGCSAGGGSVGMHLVCEESKGLLAGAVLQSGSPQGKAHLTKPWYGKDPLEQTGVAFSKKWNCETEADALAALRKVEPAKLLEAEEGTFPAAVDGWLFPDDPMALWVAHKTHDVPFMAGSTCDEGIRNLPKDVTTVASYAAWAEKTYPEDAAALLKDFPAANDAEVPGLLKRLLNTGSTTGSARGYAQARLDAGGNAWLYQMARVPNTPKAKESGAYHCIEVEYIFGNLPPGAAEDPKDQALSERIQQFLVHFAEKGDPNGTGLPEWPACSRDRLVQMVFDADCRATDAPNMAATRLFLKRKYETIAKRMDPAAASAKE